MREQSATPHGADAFDIFETTRLTRLAAPGTHPGNGKAMSFVSNHGNEH